MYIIIEDRRKVGAVIFILGVHTARRQIEKDALSNPNAEVAA